MVAACFACGTDRAMAACGCRCSAFLGAVTLRDGMRQWLGASGVFISSSTTLQALLCLIQAGGDLVQLEVLLAKVVPAAVQLLLDACSKDDKELVSSTMQTHITQALSTLFSGSSLAVEAAVGVPVSTISQQQGPAQAQGLLQTLLDKNPHMPPLLAELLVQHALNESMGKQQRSKLLERVAEVAQEAGYDGLQGIEPPAVGHDPNLAVLKLAFLVRMVKQHGAGSSSGASGTEGTLLSLSTKGY
jgi:hypothetical protein